MKERRVALLGLNCWGGPSKPNDETQQFESTQAFEIIRERLNEKDASGEMKDIVGPVPQLVRKEPLQSQSIESIDDAEVEPVKEPCEELEPIEEVRDPNDDSVHSLPVLPGCLDKNFKCPVSILQHDVDTIVSMGYTTEDAETALVNSRGKLDDAVESLVRPNHQRDVEVPSRPDPASPSAADLVLGVEAVSRTEQQDLKDGIKGNESDNEEEEDEAAGKKGRKNGKGNKGRGKAKAKAMKKGTGKGKGKGQAKAKAKAKSKNVKAKNADQTATRSTRKRKTEQEKDATGTKVARGRTASDKPTTVKKARVEKLDDEPEKEKVQGKRKVQDDASVGTKKPRKSTGKKNGQGTVTFARRYIPKSEPLRTVWQCARKAYEEIKGNFKSPSTLEDRGASSNSWTNKDSISNKFIGPYKS